MVDAGGGHESVRNVKGFTPPLAALANFGRQRPLLVAEPRELAEAAEELRSVLAFGDELREADNVDVDFVLWASVELGGGPVRTLV